MYTLIITAAGVEYNFNELTATAVKHLIENSHRVTKVTVMRDGVEIDRNELVGILYGTHLTAV